MKISIEIKLKRPGVLIWSTGMQTEGFALTLTNPWGIVHVTRLLSGMLLSIEGSESDYFVGHIRYMIEKIENGTLGHHEKETTDYAISVIIQE